MKFEGWYFKYQNEQEAIAFIVGTNTGSDKRDKAFIQIITKDSSYVVDYKYSEVVSTPSRLTIGKNIFSKRGIKLDIKTENVTCKGSFKHGEFTPLKYDIMGPFSLIKNMECNHGIISLRHHIEGKMVLNEKTFYIKGIGYIEKDYGTSFPNYYQWVQCNCFEDKTSIVVSVADIPILKGSFRGLIGIVHYKGKEYRFATYNFAKILKANKKEIELKKGKYRLKIEFELEGGQALKAPAQGDMERTIYENIAAYATFDFYKGNEKIFSKISNMAGIEIEGY